MDLIVYAQKGVPMARAVWKGVEYPALVGRNGVIEADKKREGDGCAPVGRWGFLKGLYRPDRMVKPTAGFEWIDICEGDCICDVVDDPLYNTFVRGTHPWAAEYGKTGTFWKDGPEYDVLYWLDYNVAPIVPGKGSAILLHGWRQGATHSGGCVVLPNEVLRRLAGEFVPGDGVDIRLED